MTILMIPRGVPTSRETQYGNFEYEQAKAFVRLGHKVIIATVDTRFRFIWRKVGFSIYQQDNILIYTLFICPGVIIGLFGTKALERFLSWQWRKMANCIMEHEGKIDVIYPHYLFNTHKAVHFFNQFHAPVVAMEHWSEINKPIILPHIQKMGEDTYPKVDKLLTVSNAAGTSIKKHFGVDSTVVHNMIGDNFTYVPQQHERNRVLFVSTGNLIHRKGFDLLIESFARLQLPKDKWALNIIGTGEKYDDLKKLIAKHNLTENIHLIGKQTSEQIIKWLNESDVFVLSSRMETFGVVYIEAMACGLPIIATPCGGPEEYVNEKNGLLVPVDDVDALATAIKYMYEHHQDYDRQAIADDCKARFSSEVISKQLIDIFADVLNEANNH